MIIKPTVFILGAGASASYNFPLGSELKNQIIDSLTSNFTSINNYSGQTGQVQTNSDIDFFESAGYDESKLNALREGLKFSGQNSIDAFLENRPEFIALGKLIIAKKLLGYEEKDALYNAKKKLVSIYF